MTEVMKKRVLSIIILLIVVVACVFLGATLAPKRVLAQEMCDVPTQSFTGTVDNGGCSLTSSFDVAFIRGTYHVSNSVLYIDVEYGQVGNAKVESGQYSVMSGTTHILDIKSGLSFKNTFVKTVSSSIPLADHEFLNIWNTDIPINIEIVGIHDRIGEKSHPFYLNAEFYLRFNDFDPPSGTLNGATNGSWTSNDVSLTWNTPTYENYRATLDGNAYTTGTVVKGEGWHTFKMYDRANNATTYTFAIDKTKPTLSSSVATGGHTNQLVTITAQDAHSGIREIRWTAPNGATGTVNSNTFTLTANDGTWSFYSIDNVGYRSDNYYIVYDNSEPTLSSYGISSGAYTNQLITVRVEDLSLQSFDYIDPTGKKVILDITKIKQVQITAINGTWTFSATDIFGKSSVFIVIYDDTKPTISSIVTSNGYTNKCVEIIANDNINLKRFYYKAPNGVDTLVNSAIFTITAINGRWEFYALDQLDQRSTTYFITYDDVAPTLSSSVANDAFTNQSVYVVGDDETSLKGVSYKLPNSATFIDTTQSMYNVNSENGRWEVVAYDMAGNASVSYFITYDDVTPTLSSSVASGAFTNQLVVIDESDNLGALTIYYKNPSGTEYMDAKSQSFTLLAENGAWSFYALDKAQNRSATFNVTYDDVAPTLSSSVANDAFTNKLVVISESDNLGALTIYYKNPSGTEYMDAKSQSFTLLAENGAWSFYALDKAQNRSAIFNVTYDDVTPTLSSSVASGAFTNQLVVIDESDNLGALTIYYKNPSGTEYMDAKSQSFTLLAENGAWSFYALDKAQNRSAIFNVTYDDIAPILSARKNSDVVSSGMYCKTNDLISITIEELNKNRLELDGSAISSIDLSTLAEGRHRVVAIDKAQNSSAVFEFVYITTILTLDIKGDFNLVNGIYYTNKNLTIESVATLIDSASTLRGINVKKGNGAYSLRDTSTFELSSALENCDTYSMYAEDFAGNVSATKTIVVDVVSDFGNKDAINKSYKVNEWYEVNLPNYIFSATETLPTIAGKYSFEKYDNALEWCKSLEFLYRVQTKGANFIYVSSSNESVSQVYANKDDLDKVILKYAKRYVSERRIARLNGTNDYGISNNSSGVRDDNALVRQTLKMPTFLSEYASLSLYQLNSKHQFTRPTTRSTTSITLTFIANDIALEPNVTCALGYDKTVREYFPKESYKQGYYLATEQDLCGNVQTYLVYLDIEAPSLSADITSGDNTIQNINIDTNYIAEHAGAIYCLTFDIQSLMDNVDEFLSIRIEGAGCNATFIKGDKLPLLNAKVGSGSYKITIYDRSNNALTFDINIAGQLPTMENSSVKPTAKALTIVFYVNDYLNNLVSLNIYKINGKGEEIRLLTDDKGVAIDFLTLEYQFTTGGQYQAVVVDRYNRTIRFKALFYERGLPFGMLSVNSESLTNKDVTFSYYQGNAVTVYKFNELGATWELFTEYQSSLNGAEKLYTLYFTAEEKYNGKFLVHLYSEADDNLYMEYGFTIDTIIAQVTAKVGDKVINAGDYTNKAFLLTWQEDGVMIEYTLNGEAVVYRYHKNDSLFQNGLYNFVIRDKVGNTQKFTIYLDTIVDYKLEGETINVGGKYLANHDVTLTVNETFKTFKVESNNGYTFESGVAIHYEGVYTITIVDKFDNTITLIIELDLTAPTLELDGVKSGATTKDAVTVTYEEGAKGYLTNASGDILRDVVSGEAFKDHGSVFIKVVDVAGNATKATFNIDIKVEFSSDVVNNQIITNAFKFELNEDGAIEIKRNGEVIEKASSYTLQGAYEIVGTDIAGNSMMYNVVILPRYAKEQVLTLKQGHSVVKCQFNDKDIDIAPNAQDELILVDTGKYTITIKDAPSDTVFTLELGVDNVAPSLKVVYDNVKNQISFAEINKSDLIATLLKDGVEIEFRQNLGSSKTPDITSLSSLMNTVTRTIIHSTLSTSLVRYLSL